ncbi:MAG: prepilin-type N-terminal cleavage/methylation domain-containing protein [Candidatus Atribacteria bacterium]|nr:prepilin-type N-terminal cleavage/methylation domain-containing protein [Candidatus Atribacteria bacterium]
MFFSKQNLSGFTLVEALIAMSILIVGVISGFLLVTKALYNVTIIQDRLTASFLAQEGVELIRQLRDTNFLQQLKGENIPWDSNEMLAHCKQDNEQDNGCLIWANPRTNQVITSALDSVSSPQTLYYHPETGLYNYEPSDYPTTFKRIIHLSSISPNELKVQVEMTWQSKGMDFWFTVEDHLFNWLQAKV